MSKSQHELEQEAQALLAPFGVSTLGWFSMMGSAALLVGNLGPDMWNTFSQSAEHADGKSDPLDRWTQRALSGIAREMDGEVCFPFGEPVWPFQQWAMEAIGCQTSPLGILMHPEAGLWWGLRGALVFDVQFEEGEAAPLPHACDGCADKPCLSSCPVGAFTGSSYDVVGCRSHIGSSKGQNCLSTGCLARNVCPVGQAYVYSDAQQQFHMKAFRK